MLTTRTLRGGLGDTLTTLRHHRQVAAKGTKALDNIRAAREAAIDAEAEAEATAVRRRNQLAPDRRNKNAI